MTEYFNSLANAVNSLLGVPDQISAAIDQITQQIENIFRQLQSFLQTAKLAYEILIAVVIILFFVTCVMATRIKRMEKNIEEMAETLQDLNRE